MASPIKIAVAGARGHMGRSILSAFATDPAFTFVGGFGRAGSAATELAELGAIKGGPALVIGATGFEQEELTRISDAARKIPIVRSGNFSIGVNVLLGLVAQVACSLPPET